MKVEAPAWVRVAAVEDFANTDRQLIWLDPEQPVGLFKLSDGFYALGAWCSHERFSLVDGVIEDHAVECPGHGACFDLRTGRPLSLPAVRAVEHYEVKVEAGQVFIRPSVGRELPT